MKAELLHLTPLKSAYFASDEMTLSQGDVRVVSASSMEQGQAFADSLLGLSDPLEGCVKLLGKPIYQLPGSIRLELLQDVSHVSGGLVSNLKIWENLLLPAQFHHRVTEVEAERRLMEAIEVLDNAELWKTSRLFALPDTLSPLASRVAGLLQAAVTRPKLIVGEFLLNDLEPGPLARLMKLLSWLKRQEPQLGFLFIHLGPLAAEYFSLNTLGEIEMVTLAPGTHAIPENH